MSNLNRRRFLTQSAVVSMAAIGSARMVHQSMAAEPAASPNEQLGVCIAGLNGRGGEHIRGFAKDKRTTIVAIVDVDADMAKRRAREIAKQQGSIPEIYTDVRKAMESKTVDILSVATPNHWHALMGIWAMQAGKDLYLEKPISHNIHEGRSLVAAANKYKRVFQTGTQCRSSQAMIDLVKYIEEGNIGECDFARGLCYKRRKSIGALGDYPVPENIDFELWTGPATVKQPRSTRVNFHYDWHWQRHYGNGDLGNQGPHQTDVARWGLGLNRHPNSILSYGGRLGYPAERKDPSYVDAGDTANTEVSIYDYGDKTIVFETRGLDVSESSGPEIDKIFGRNKDDQNRIGVIFYGTKGYAAQLQYHHGVALDKDLNVVKEFKTGDVGDAHFSNFIGACLSRDRAAVHADAMTGHLSAAVSHLGNISYYLGEQNRVPVEKIKETIVDLKSRDDNVETLTRTVEHLKANGVDLEVTPMSLGPQLTFDPETERFIGNEDANALLTREYRAGFEVPSADKV
jgi:predicted dehydrogenase